MAQGYTGQGTPETGEGHVTLLGWNYDYITAGNWLPLSDVAYSMYTMFYNTSNTENDQVDYYIWLAAGTYSLDVFGSTGNMGINTYYLDAVSLGTLDWYAASAVYGVKQTIASIVVASPGRKIFSMKSTGHTTTTNHYMYIHSFCFFRTA